MNNLAKFFPLSAKFSNTGGQLAAGIAIYLGASIVLSLILTGIACIIAFILGLIIPGAGFILGIIIGIIPGLICSVINLYALAGIVIEILMFTKAIK